MIAFITDIRACIAAEMKELSAGLFLCHIGIAMLASLCAYAISFWTVWLEGFTSANICAKLCVMQAKTAACSYPQTALGLTFARFGGSRANDRVLLCWFCR